MAYITGSVTDANPGPALYALMAPALTTAGFTLVDTVVISTRTHKIWKSPAAGNVQNLDWYLDIGYTTTGTGTISLVAFEMFDPATDLGYRGPHTSTSTVIDAATGSRYGATGAALETNWAPNASTAGIQTALPVTVFGYWISVTANRVALLSSSAPTVIMHAGFYTPDPLYVAKAGAKLFPLITGKVGAESWNLGALALTRAAPLTAFPGASNWGDTVSNAGHLPVSGVWPLLPSGTTAVYPFTAQRSPLHSVPGNLLNIGRWGWLDGVVTVPSVGVVRGDTVSVDGAPYVLGTTLGTGAQAYSWALKAV